MGEPDFSEPDFSIDEPEVSVISVPVIVSLTIIVMIPIYAFYVIYSMNQAGDKPEVGILDYLKMMSLGIFLLSQSGQIFLCLYSKWQLDRFLRRYPVIENQKIF